MRLSILLFLFISLTLKINSQVSAIKGNISEENSTPIGYASLVLLNPSDSTMAYYGITNEQGFFEIKGIKSGKYLLQVAFIGHQTVYMELQIPSSDKGNLGSIVMKSRPVILGEVVVSDEYVPMQFRTDTIEFNTAAFKTKPDAVVEDLLKKLPGMEVDRAGNIKAMGEDVKKVLVDGREFFGSDPKLATRNVPADALKKIQVYDKKSDESEFTGIDDGTRDKTLNLLLKDDKKNALFGELMAGGGSGEHYLGSGKAYKFTKKNQFAALGMINNINQFGFSFRDYIDFSGGIRNMGDHGGAVRIKLPSGAGISFPVNFGQPVNGLSTSGAGGINFSQEFRKASRIFMSYIANGSDRNLLQNTSSTNFTDLSSYRQEENLDEYKLDRAQRLNFGLRNRIDSTQNLILNGALSISSGKTKVNSNTSVFNDESKNIRLVSGRNDKAKSFSGTINGSYLKLIDKGKTIFRISSDASWSRDLRNSLWNNETLFINPLSQVSNSQSQDNSSGFSDFSANTSVTRKLGRFFYLEPELKAGTQSEFLERTQGIPSDISMQIDSLSPDFTRKYNWFVPGLKLIRNTEKTQFALSVKLQLGKTSNSLNNDSLEKTTYGYFTPGLSWEYEFKTGRRLRMYYESKVNVPTVNQLLPVFNNYNPLALSRGNRYLKPEISNNLSLNLWIFDQFSFTTLLASLNTTYTRNKINWDRAIDSDLKQSMSLINVPDDYSLQGSSDFSTPIRKLGLKINTNLEEVIERGFSYVNGIKNINTNFSHRISFSVENRKKTKWDIITGGEFQITDAKFSIQESLNNRYTNFSYFTEVRYNPDKHWNFQFKADVTNYNSETFGKTIRIPLFGGEISYFFLKNNRASLTLQGVDLLNRNTGIERISELNFLREQRSNMLGRFIMVTFKFRLNKFGDAPGGIDIKINKR